MPNALPRTTLTLLLVAGACAALPLSIMAQQQPSSAGEQALKPERNPPGDIPDNQVFIDYISPLGFSLKVPEGWARQDLPDGVSFADKYGRITVIADRSPEDAERRRGKADACARAREEFARRHRGRRQTGQASRRTGDPHLLWFEFRSEPGHQQGDPIGKRSVLLLEGRKTRGGEFFRACRRRQCRPMGYDGEELSLAIVPCQSSPPTMSIDFTTRATTRRARFAGSASRSRRESSSRLSGPREAENRRCCRASPGSTFPTADKFC